MNTVSVLDLAEAGDLALFHSQAIETGDTGDQGYIFRSIFLCYLLRDQSYTTFKGVRGNNNIHQHALFY